MQYKKFEFHRLFKGCGSQQVQCASIGNQSVLPEFSYCHRWEQHNIYYSYKMI